MPKTDPTISQDALIGTFARKVTHEAALQAARNFIDQHFNNRDGNGVLTCIPARPDDDDVTLMDYIKQQQAEAHLRTPAGEAGEMVERLRTKADAASSEGDICESKMLTEAADLITRLSATPIEALQQRVERLEVMLAEDDLDKPDQFSARLTVQMNIWHAMKAAGYEPTPEAVKAIRAAAFGGLRAALGDDVG